MTRLRPHDTGEFSLAEFGDEATPPYAILSHTRGADADELTCEVMTDNLRLLSFDAPVPTASLAPPSTVVQPDGNYVPPESYNQSPDQIENIKSLWGRDRGGSYNCIHCGIRVSRKCNLLRHFKEIHQCYHPRCQGIFFQNPRMQETHLCDTHQWTREMFKCGCCGKRIMRVEKLKSHLNKVHQMMLDTNLAVTQCSVEPCFLGEGVPGGTYFPSYAVLEDHLNSYHWQGPSLQQIDQDGHENQAAGSQLDQLVENVNRLCQVKKRPLDQGTESDRKRRAHRSAFETHSTKSHDPFPTAGGSMLNHPDGFPTTEVLELHYETPESEAESHDWESQTGKRNDVTNRSVTKVAVDVTVEDYGLKSGHQEFNEVKQNLFEVVTLLGHGSLGVVEEVRVSASFSSFVRKRVQLLHFNRKQRLEIIKQEAKALEKLSHCHIVKIIGSYQDGIQTGTQFYSLLMSPVGDQELRVLLATVGERSVSGSREEIEQEISWLQRWFKCLASALAYMHSKGIRHQDIKPSNIVHRAGNIFFTDFSSAGHFEVGQTTSTENPALSSRMYSAPEVLERGEPLSRHGRSADVFALGAVFCEMLTVHRLRSVNEFHRFFQERHSLANAPHHASAPTRKPLVYAQDAECIHEWFGGEDFFYNKCVRPMLGRYPEDRPDASATARMIREFELWDPIACSCDVVDCA